MNDSPDPTGSGEYAIDVPRSRVRAPVRRRLRAAGRFGRARLARLRRWLATPTGRRTAVRAGRALAAGVGIATAVVLTRRWVALARTGWASAGGLVGVARQIVGRAGTRAVRTLGLSWVWRLLGWAGAASAPAASRGHVRCRDCHARIRADARVCFRCGCRSVGPAPQRRRARRLLLVVRSAWRLASGRTARRCPDCRRLVHADARRCWRCGAALGPRKRSPTFRGHAS